MDEMTIIESLQEALHQFTDPWPQKSSTGCQAWHRLLHDQDCSGDDTEEDNEENSLEPYRSNNSSCHCDAPYRISLVKKAMAKEISPEFVDHDFEPILEWGEAKVVKNEIPENMPDGKIAYVDDCYSLVWKYGAIGFDINDEQKASKAAALFIYLWTRGISAGVAERCATAYVLNYTVSRI